MEKEKKLNDLLNEVELENQIEVIKGDEGDGDEAECTTRTICGPKTN